jgi:hypothetical protein
MFDRARCAALRISEKPVVSIEALRSLKDLLALIWKPDLGRAQDLPVQLTDAGGIDAPTRVVDSPGSTPHEGGVGRTKHDDVASFRRKHGPRVIEHRAEMLREKKLE